MRSFLKPGVLIRVSGVIIYRISGDPIGEGGGSIIYPAVRMLPDHDGFRASHILYAVKECYPQSGRFVFHRNEDGEICAEENNAEAAAYLAKAKEMQENEAQVSGRVYIHAFRSIPILEAYREEELSFDDGKTYRHAENTISVMESLSGKGVSLKQSLADKKHLSVREAFDVIRQVLFAVGEIHKSGFLHLDLQDGNVFIKGVLDKNDSMVSLIDFGSARPLLADGRCAEITDKVLYSTQGFTAPEILQKNDGHLRLGKQADIYSIGSLALLLLTGHRYTTTELIGNKAEKYIPAFSVRKTGCPRHLTEKMQGIIANALKPDPVMRYESCNAMLQDVEELLTLLAPHADPLSATDYDAFICYKHSEKDNAAAKTLRDSLERYRDSFGAKPKINRVFLDEGEFSSCSDFGERINTALKNSKWLIVLCSGQTRQSVWVNEEIRTFLKYHDKSHVLAVITEGEPDEVYPEELVKQGLSSKNLFAADARAEKGPDILKKIRGDVCLQIAAPILETTFDALKQRNRIYKMQRASVFAAAALCVLLGFISYAAVKNHQIARQAEQIVREQTAKIESQSEVIAKQAREAYDANDYSKAMKLALSSMELSRENEDRISDLKSILIACLNLYVQPNEGEAFPVPTGMMNAGNGADLSECFMNDDGSRLFAVTDQNLSVWNTADCSMISCCDQDYEISEALYYEWENYLLEDQKSFLVCSEDKITNLSYKSGGVIWSSSFDDQEYVVKKVILSSDQKHIYRISYSYGNEKAVIDELDPVSGQIEKSHVFEENSQCVIGYACIVSPDNRYIASTGTAGTLERPETHLSVFDLKANTVSDVMLWETDLLGTDLTTWMSFADHTGILVSRYDGAMNVRMDFGEEHTSYLLEQKSFRCCRYDAADKAFAWQYNTGDEVPLLDLRRLKVPQIYSTKTDGKEVIFAGVGNTLLAIDVEDGSQINALQLDAGIISFFETDDDFRLILENGDLLILRKDCDFEYVVQKTCFPENISFAAYQNNCFYTTVRTDPGVIIKYEMNQYDESFSEVFIKDKTALSYIRELPADDSIPKDDGIWEKKTEEAGEAVQTIGMTPDKQKVFVGLENQVRLCDTDGNLLAAADLPRSVGLDPILYFPEDGTCFYGDRTVGFLIDLNENSIKIIKYLKDVVAFDHSSDSFIICSDLSGEDGGCTVGRIKYHTLEEIKEKAVAAVNDTAADE